MTHGNSPAIPLLIEVNSDESCSFGVSRLDSETDIFNNLLYYHSYAVSPLMARKLVELYPNDPGKRAAVLY